MSAKLSYLASLRSVDSPFPATWLFGLLQTHGQYIARRAVEDVVCGRPQQQGESVATMAADHDQITALFLRQAVYFLAGLSVGKVAILRCQTRVAVGEAVHALACLVELLLLTHRKVPRHVAAEGREIGRAAWRERESQDGEIWVGAYTL